MSQLISIDSGVHATASQSMPAASSACVQWPAVTTVACTPFQVHSTFHTCFVNRSEVEPEHIGILWWEVDAHPVVDLNVSRNAIKGNKFVPCMIIIDYGCGICTVFGIILKYCVVISGLGINSGF